MEQTKSLKCKKCQGELFHIVFQIDDWFIRCDVCEAPIALVDKEELHYFDNVEEVE